MSTEKETKKINHVFTHDNIMYTLRFNSQKMETYEGLHNCSFSAVIRANGGVLPLTHSRTLFVSALVDSKDGTPVEQRRAAEIYEDVLKEKGALTINSMIVDKVALDCPFLFR